MLTEVINIEGRENIMGISGEDFDFNWNRKKSGVNSDNQQIFSLCHSKNIWNEQGEIKIWE
jgi:hypothetical protein